MLQSFNAPPENKEPLPESTPQPTRYSQAWLDELFTYHAPNEFQLEQYKEIRQAANYFASVLINHTPDCADRMAALRKLREVVMTANAAVALHGLI